MAGVWIDKGKFKIPNPTIRDVDNNHPIVDSRGLFVLHAVLLKTGKVLLFCGHVENAHYAKLSYVWNPDKPDDQMSPIPFPGGIDLFCCHYVQLADGKILVVGGSIDFHAHPMNPDRLNGGSFGKKTISIFNPDTESWTLSKDGATVNEMDHGRWYPTAVALGDGSVAVFSGRREDSIPPDAVSDKVELISGSGINFKARTVTGFNNSTFKLPLYPGMVLAPDGKIYYVGTTWGQRFTNPKTRSISINNSNSASPTGSWDTYGNVVTPLSNRREEGTFVLLPPAQDGKILVVGGSMAVSSTNTPIGQAGGPAAFDHIFDANDPFSAQILDTSTNPPTWSAAGKNEANEVGKTNGARINGHCVILPDATVFLLGGADGYRWRGKDRRNVPLTTATRECEIFDGVEFKKESSLHHPRRYHSVALLLPDGSVFAAGGADPDKDEPILSYPAGWNAPRVGPNNVLNRRDYEIFKPDYFGPGRPRINKVMLGEKETKFVFYGSTFQIYTPQGNTITRAALIRPGAPTHHTDTEQRYVDLTIKSKSANKIDVELTSNKNLAPPGFYMLWILKGDKPCEKAVFILVGELELPGNAECVIATAATGSPHSEQVEYLQSLRNELKTNSLLGKSFIAFVNSAYYSFSPSLAKVIASSGWARILVNYSVVLPTWKIIKASQLFVSKCIPKNYVHPLLILILAVESLFALIFLPVLFLITLLVLFHNKISDR